MLATSTEQKRDSAGISISLGEILDLKADYLISSGNPWLNMSGGVNGALLEKFGDALQQELQHHLARSLRKAVPPGFCYRWEQAIGGYRGVAYCVAIDPFYDSSPELVTRTLLTGVALLSPKPGESVVFPALGTGYGHLSKVEFGRALRSVSGELTGRYPGTHFCLVDRNSVAVEELKESSGIQ